ncbi:MAG TPA: TIR domain-containing protein, partial [Longimicrobium sp.]
MKPIVFVGTSSEGKQKYGPDFRLLMGNEVEVRFWSDNLFLLGSSALESLVTIRRQCDFAVLLFSGDDLLQKRRTQARAPRDNLLLEFGLFCATLGRSRAFIVHNSEEQLSLPSDLAGITLASFAYSGREHLSSALGLATDTILRRIREEWASDAVRRLRAFDAGIAIAHLVTRAGLPDTMTFHYRSAFREMLKDAFLR